MTKDKQNQIEAMEKAIKQLQREVEEATKEQKTLEVMSNKLISGKMQLETAIDKADVRRSQTIRASIDSESPRRKLTIDRSRAKNNQTIDVTKSNQ
jgi:hypothetical protein